MSEPPDPRVLEADVVVVGSGIAGLSAALAATDPGGPAGAGPGDPGGHPGPRGGARRPLQVVLLTPGRLGGDGASALAQGGIAAALAAGDSPALHALDTHRAGAGLTQAERVEILASEGPARVRELVRMGVRFDREASGALALGLEGAHSRRRIAHALGDRTGWEVTRVLAEAALARPGLRIYEGVHATGLLGGGERESDGPGGDGVSRPASGAPAWGRDGVPPVAGVRGMGAEGSALPGPFLLRARAVILATGGGSHLYRRTTVPAFALGEGMAMAHAVGARLEGMEFVQFHPTALRVDADPLPLVTEALRGEGAQLVDPLGIPLPVEDPLASRDRVSRLLWLAMAEGTEPFLDARSAVGEAFPTRFPGVWARCRAFGIDPRRDLIPVTPAAHYQMGGIAVDAWGRSSVPGLWAAGEVASSGIHGANRLASNSLLEGLVYGRRAGVAAALAMEAEGGAGAVPPSGHTAGERAVGSHLPSSLPPGDLLTLRTLLWEGVGVVRDAEGIRGALAGIEVLERRNGPGCAPLVVARAIAEAALARRISIGSHIRGDALPLLAEPRSLEERATARRAS